MTDHYLEQLRHQLAQTRAELRRAEDELAVHRQRASRETRLRLAWQSARRRAAAAETRLAAVCMEPVTVGPFGKPWGPRVVKGPHVEHQDANGTRFSRIAEPQS